MEDKDTILVDFDGVLHRYQMPWEQDDIIPDPPVIGAGAAIRELREKYQVIVYSTRARTLRGIQAMRRWLKKHNIEVDEVTQYKLPAKLLIDDRAIQFRGDWNAILSKVDGFLPWNRKDEK